MNGGGGARAERLTPCLSPFRVKEEAAEDIHFPLFPLIGSSI